MVTRQLDDGGLLISSLWLDQPDALEQIAERQAKGALSDTDAASLAHFVEHGYLTLHLDLPDSFFDDFEADVERTFAERPADLALAARGVRTRFSESGAARGPGTRIPDFHSHSDAALALYLDVQVFRTMELIFDEPAVAFQSLYFDYGSQQDLHRDPMFVVTKPASHLVAAWVALEDITADSGPLMYVPGSHRMPWFEFEDGDVAVGRRSWKEKQSQWEQDRDRAIREMGLEVKELTCGRGDVFVWHGALLHGGRHIADRSTTRRSFVTHYSSRRNYTERSTNMRVKSGTGWTQYKGHTSRVLEIDGRGGIDNPLRGAPTGAPAKGGVRRRVESFSSQVGRKLGRRASNGS